MEQILSILTVLWSFVELALASISSVPKIIFQDDFGTEAALLRLPQRVRSRTFNLMLVTPTKGCLERMAWSDKE
ncbi:MULTISPECIES: hypothetical protein [unclassified Caballeronia]|uniref:hypothetical protein n=1 Tax=unclassified Caballeronia TaxID=2646786 RepID=UPI002027FF65|nr:MULTISPECIES: hypothetical protein [unclassified Caballeronia]